MLFNLVPPSFVKMSTRILGGKTTQEVCFTSVFPGQLSQRQKVDSLASILEGFEYNPTKSQMVFGGKWFNVVVADDSLLINYCGEASKEIDYIRYSILKTIRKYVENAHSSLNLAQILLEVTNTDQLFDSLILEVIAEFKRRFPDVDDSIWSELMCSLDENIRNIWMEDMVRVYTENYSKQELFGLIEFYQTDLGGKMLSKMPTISAQFMDVGSKASIVVANFIREHLGTLVRVEM